MKNPPTSRLLSSLVVSLPLAAAVVLGGCKGDAPKAQTGPEHKNVDVTVDDKGFSPSKIDLKAGQHATLTFTRKSDHTCATEVAFPELSLKKALPLNTPVTVDIPTDKARTLAFQCGMGMYKSSVVISGS